MAKIATTDKSTSNLYTHLAEKASESDETNDCAVKAVAAVAMIPYEAARKLLKDHRRKDRKGTSFPKITKPALEAAGYKVEQINRREFIGQYPGTHKNLRNVTTHHPKRFHKVWADGSNYLLRTDGHIVGVVNGINHDWTKGRAFRVRQIWKVTKI